MRKNAVRSALALLIIGGCLSAAAPANATIWWNMSSSLEYPTRSYYVLYGGTGQGDVLAIYPYAPLSSYGWSLSPDPNRPGYDRLVKSSGLVAGVSANNMSNGTLVRLWQPTGEANQSWKLELANTYDDGGQATYCYRFVNANAVSGRTIVLGVSGAVMASGTPIRIWDWLNHPDQVWCAYVDDGNGNLVPENNPPPR